MLSKQNLKELNQLIRLYNKLIIAVNNNEEGIIYNKKRFQIPLSYYLCINYGKLTNTSLIKGMEENFNSLYTFIFDHIAKQGHSVALVYKNNNDTFEIEHLKELKGRLKLLKEFKKLYHVK